MGRYLVCQRYSSRRDGQQFGPWPVGQEVELADDDAAWVGRDAPGTLTAVEPEPEVGAGGDTVIDIPTVEVVEVVEVVAPEPVVEPEPEPEAEAADGDDTERQSKPARDRQHRAARNRSA